MPTNLYGPNDNFDLQNSHVLPALIRKFHEAKESNAPYVECWGDGSPMREFLHVDDLAEACFRCMISYNDSEIINVGTGEDLTIKELTELISIIIGYKGEIKWDDSKPNGTLRKVLNVDKIKSLGWSPKIGIRQGIYETYEWYKNEQTSNL
jgi:GDP-L-fucose synthase